MKNIISVAHTGKDGVLLILDEAEKMLPYAKEKKLYPLSLPQELARPEVFGLFLEKTLRTWGSFKTAARLLGFEYRPILGIEQTSIPKEESFANTIRMLVAQQGADILAIRTQWEGAALFATEVIAELQERCSVVNGGDGSLDHPTQNFLDLFAIRRKFGRLDDFTVALCGDVAYSRVAHGMIDAAKFFGFRIGIFAPPVARPPRYWLKGVDVVFESNSYDDLRQCDIWYALRPQKERHQDPVEFQRELKHYQVTPAILDKYGKTNVLVMHAQPVDKKDDLIKLFPGVFRDLRLGFIHEQARHAVPTRMAILKLAYLGRFEENLSQIPGAFNPEVVKDESIEAHIRRLKEKRAEIFKPISHGTVIDHLPVNCSDVVELLLEKMGVRSKPYLKAKGIDSTKMGEKDVMVLGNVFLSHESMAMVSLIAPQATFNVLKDGRIQKLRMPLPKVIPAIFPCPNPLCITNYDPEAQARFLYNQESGNGELIDIYCQRVFEMDEIVEKIKS